MSANGLSDNSTVRFFLRTIGVTSSTRVRLVGASIIILLALAGITAAARYWRADPTGSAHASVTNNPQVAQNAVRSDADYVRRRRLPPQLRDAIKVLGDRLENPGKERLVATGTLEHLVNSEMVSSQIRLVMEFPDRLRLEEQSNEGHITGFDGRSAWKQGGALDEHDQDSIESLIFDSADHFFIGQSRGFPTRNLGTRFRLDDGNGPYAGPYYDVFEVVDQIAFEASVRPQAKFYYFNSENHLLERLRYEIYRRGSSVKIEVLLSGWNQYSGQQVPGTITRFENGEPVSTLTIQNVSIRPRVADGLFAKVVIP